MSSHPFPESAGHPEVARRLGADPAAVTYRQLARGVTHDTLIVAVDGEPAAVLRLAPPRAEILPRLQPAEEGHLLELLAGSELPVPEALIVDPDGSRLGRPGLLMSYVSGANTLTWERLRERAGDGVGPHALETLVTLHELAPPPGWPEADTPETHAIRELAGTHRLAWEGRECSPPNLRPILDRLAAAIPKPSGPPCIVHGDYRPANLMGAGGRVTGILDWEMATAGDPACDFGVSTMREWGVWFPDEELLARYRDARGVEVPLSSLRWWRALGYCKVVAFLAARHADGWDDGAAIAPWAESLDRALGEWSKQ